MVQAGLELTIFLLQFPKYQDYRCGVPFQSAFIISDTGSVLPSRIPHCKSSWKFGLPPVGFLFIQYVYLRK